MDIDIPKSYSNTHIIGGHFPLRELGLGEFTLSDAKKVENLNSFRFDKDLGNIIKKNTRRFPVSRIAPLSIITEKFVVENITEDPGI